MNVLRRAIAGEILPSSSSLPTKSSLFTRLHPQNHQTFPLQEPCCLYSTATTTSPSKSMKKQVGTPKTTETSKTHKENPPKLPRTWAKEARQLLVQPPEKAELQKVLNGEGYRKDLPRPSEIQWQKKAANSVNLIGHIQIPVQFEASQDGKYWAGTLISEANAGALGNSAFWIPIIFEGDLAHIAACHLKPTDYVHIAGELNSDLPPFALKEAQGSVQVMVHNIYFVHESSQANTFTSENPEELDKFGTSSSVIETKSGGNTESKFPDLEHKSKHTADGSSYETREWALAVLNGSQVESTEIKSTTMPPNPTPKKESQGDNPWNNLVKNLNKWWDKRKNKVNPKGPDFIHKDTREALWLDGCPPSLRSSLPPPGSPFDVQLSNPTLKEEIKATAMPPNPTPKKESEEDNPWNNLVKNPNKWWDNRKNKVNPKSPDFIHKDTREALWLDGCPPSLRSSLPPGSPFDVQLSNPTLKEEIKATATPPNPTPKKVGSEGDTSWKDLVENPNKWWDNRKKKVNPKAPDFVHKDTRETLWLNRCPPSLRSRLSPSGAPFDAQLSNPTLKEEIKATPTPPNPTPKKVASEGDTSWKDLVENPNKWWDNRKKKVNPKAPDFVHKDTREALWLNRCPPSLRSSLPPPGSPFDAPLSNPTLKEEIKATPTPPNPTPKKVASEGDTSWKDLVENPNKWWDNRKKKVNPKAPDFVHKDTREALWLKRCPPSLRSSLRPPGSPFDAQLSNPTLKEEIKATPTPPTPTPKKVASEGDTSWEDLVENPNKWWDNRKKKVNPKAPDFVHKDTREALWLKRCPPSLRSSLRPPGSPFDAQLSNPTLKEEIKATPKPPNPTPKKVASEGDTSWEDLVENPNKWWDNRKKKVNPRAPDFKHKDTGEALWLNCCPPSLRSRLSPSGAQVDAQLPNPTPKEEIKATAEESWKDLVENPNKWWDNRKGKVNPRAPDFKHKDTMAGLWVSRCPASLISRLPHP